MSAPAPTPYLPDSYSVNSAGQFAGDPLIEVLHSFYHAGEDDWDTTNGYAESVVGFIVATVVIGLIFMCCMWCFNLCACCRCCREKCCKVCFSIFEGKQKLGEIIIIILFFVTAVIATCSYAGRSEFNDAAYEIGDEIRSLAGKFDVLEDLAEDLVDETVMLANFTNRTNCDFPDAQEGFEEAQKVVSEAAGSIYDMLEGLGDTIRDGADYIEDNAPYVVDLNLGFLTAIVWFNALFGTFAICTENSKCDDCFSIFLGTLTLIVFTIVVSLEVALTVTVADFCFKGPTESVQNVLGTDNDLLSYYLTCNGTWPLASVFNEVDESLEEYSTTVREVRDNQFANCNDGPMTSIMVTVNTTRTTLESIEGASGCAFINLTFTGISHGIVCDEVVRGLFVCFMVHAASALLLFITLMVFPCAANSQPRFDDHHEMARHVSAKLMSQPPPIKIMQPGTEADLEDELSSKETPKSGGADNQNPSLSYKQDPTGDSP